MYYDYEQYIGNGIKFEKQLQSSVGEFGCAQATPKPATDRRVSTKRRIHQYFPLSIGEKIIRSALKISHFHVQSIIVITKIRNI